ncbi:hypothetical protein PCANC_00071 [Puccinia coronata f. sp. avenae]|uniref:Uncharacterized protein n=1 Tax=Puccinia coronata f. sp. avenae TaxID=200324 RepID=A0A2N5W8T5_9BASI|nr:hypothetical protein PCANC_00071 [Puccinia coronata f. sp. avenae]
MRHPMLIVFLFFRFFMVLLIMTFSIQDTLYTIRRSKRAAVGQAEISFNSGTEPQKTTKHDSIASVA